MTILLTYYHAKRMTISFSLDADERDFAIGFGETCEEAKNNLRQPEDGWDKDLHDKYYRYDQEKPYFFVIKELEDGSRAQMDKCINVLEDRPSPDPNQITIRQIHF